MAKGTLEFKLPEERIEFETAVNAGAYKHVLWEVEQEVFRPARKHGYRDRNIQNLVELLDDLVKKECLTNVDYPKDEYGDHLDASTLIHMLEKLYFEVKTSTLSDED